MLMRLNRRPGSGGRLDFWQQPILNEKQFSKKRLVGMSAIFSCGIPSNWDVAAAVFPVPEAQEVCRGRRIRNRERQRPGATGDIRTFRWPKIVTNITLLVSQSGILIL